MDRFSRTELLIGKKKLSKLRAGRVTVVGMGAVGGYAVEALARSGLGAITLVDFDKISRSNINRNILALDSTVGKSKVRIAAERVQDISPDCVPDVLEVFAAEETMDKVLAGPPDVLVDAIDSVNPKVQLLKSAYERRIRTVSSMGAALRTDPSRIRTGDLFKTRNCPLARFIRKRLRKKGIVSGITCVYSDEQNRSEGIEYPDTEIEYRRGRPRRAIGSLSAMPGIFGLTLANMAIDIIIGGFDRD